MRKELTPTGVLLACMLPIIASGQAERVTDLNTSGAGSDPEEFVRLGANTFFVADDGEHGTELWVIPDGSAAHLVKDIKPGPLSSSPSYLVAMGTQLFFSATTEGEGRELWKSDGSESGTVLVADIYPGAENGAPKFLTVLGSNLFFSADDGVAGRELWISDGTAASLLMDIEPGIESSFPSEFLEVPDGSGTGTMLIFSAYTAAAGTEPWLTQGTPPSTAQLDDLNSGPASSVTVVDPTRST